MTIATTSAIHVINAKNGQIDVDFDIPNPAERLSLVMTDSRTSGELYLIPKLDDAGAVWLIDTIYSNHPAFLQLVRGCMTTRCGPRWARFNAIPKLGEIESDRVISIEHKWHANGISIHELKGVSVLSVTAVPLSAAIHRREEMRRI